MSLDKAILHRHEHRRPYYGAARFDRTCRNHGHCPWCQRNRHFGRYRMDSEVADRLADFFCLDLDTEV